jgi:uncharacterized protein YfaQ (DUF2300 family)
VNQRATSWLLAALMAVCAAQAVPAARVQRTAENCPIIWIAEARVEQRVAIRKTASSPRLRMVIALPDEPVSISSLFSKSLYQRPPPVSLSPR